MDKYEYQVIMARIQEIEQEQLSILDYVCKYIDCNIKINVEGIKERMLRLRKEKEKLISMI